MHTPTENKILTTADKLTVGTIIPSKIGSAAFRVIYVEKYTDPMLGPAVYVSTEGADSYRYEYKFRPFDKLWIRG